MVKYSQVTLLVNLSLKNWVDSPTNTYMAEAKVIDHIVVTIGQKEKTSASSPMQIPSNKLCITTELCSFSSILTDQSTCKISRKLTKNTSNPFQTNNRLNACMTLNRKKAVIRVNKKATVEAALYKGIVLMAATLKTF